MISIDLVIYDSASFRHHLVSSLKYVTVPISCLCYLLGSFLEPCHAYNKAIISSYKVSLRIKLTVHIALSINDWHELVSIRFQYDNEMLILVLRMENTRFSVYIYCIVNA